MLQVADSAARIARVEAESAVLDTAVNGSLREALMGLFPVASATVPVTVQVTDAVSVSVVLSISDHPQV